MRNKKDIVEVLKVPGEDKKVEKINAILEKYTEKVPTSSVTFFEGLKEVLNGYSVSYSMFLNRFQSLVMVEGHASYDIQSQRYNTYDDTTDIIIGGKINEVAKLDISLNDNVNPNYKHDKIYVNLEEEILDTERESLKLYLKLVDDGIKSELARSFIGTGFTCNQVVTFSGKQLIEFLMDSYKYEAMFENVREGLFRIHPVLKKICNSRIKETGYARHMQFEVMDKILDEQYPVLGKTEIDQLSKGAISALVCTNKESAQDFAETYSASIKKSCGVIKRVAINTRHLSTIEHITYRRHTSLPIYIYNQYIRQRHCNLQHYSWYRIAKDFCKNVEELAYSPYTLVRKVFGANVADNEIIAKYLVEITKLCTRKMNILKSAFNAIETSNNHNSIKALQLAFVVIPFGTEIDIFINDNVRDVCQISKLRTCGRAQADFRKEIMDTQRELVKIEPNMLPILQGLGEPNCMCGGCLERTPCALGKEVRDFYNIELAKIGGTLDE